ncbi:MAG: DUF2283 domain-containing protein, partial [Caldimonas sp.]
MALPMPALPPVMAATLARGLIGVASLGAAAMKTTYYEDDDTLVIRLSDKPIVREVSQDWNTHVSY